MDVSRQSVSKWERANSIPDLNKIIKLAENFGVSVDYLVKDEIEEVQTSGEDVEPDVIKVSLDDATQYVRSKIDMSRNISKGVLLCIYSIITFSSYI
ncbi:MAG: helix-turn-helix transcriptional regulator [Clostridiales bacterium]|nr:helix-turn-helix transcriptional regulator [Clostridiales bacterium]